MILNLNVTSSNTLQQWARLLTGLLFACALQAQAQAEEIWIDVRSEQEYSQGHYESAINIPFMKIMQRIGDVTTDKQANIRLYCSAGARAEIARQILQNMGYENVVNEGGLADLKQ